ncbi:MAG: glyceraldehyde 3-phosphate dehydrogenase NAD-binding domain-containing protein, partial [Nanoarchaeota archaeon]|nr:glyceraldehyde 3-phosphate dehydrogenase NAD-binding domain-containing protein [Nanoarchaeota archaeon]
MVKIGINGFGRIGRAFFRAGFKALNIVAINSPSNAENIAHLLKYDTVYGKFPGKIRYTKNALYVNGKKIKLFFEREPEKIPWKDLGVHIVVECSGIFCDKDSASKHLKAGAKKVIISAPAKGVNLTVVNGINDKKIKKQKIISNASCTTNCLAPIAKIIDDNLGLKRGFMTTIHSYTKDQNLVDATHKKDYRRGRAAA